MRLLTYNIHKGIGGRDRRYQLERIVEVIQHATPDVVCLQEVDRHVRRSRFDDQPQRLASELGFAHRLYQLNVPLKHGGYGNLILSRWPLLASHQISLRLKQKKPRGAQLAICETPQGPVFIINTHLGLSESERQWQLRHLLTHHLTRPWLHLPTILLGDTNDWRNQLRKMDVAAPLQLVTHPMSRFRTFPAWLPLGSLDKIFVNRQIVVQECHPIRTKLAKIASDHLPLMLQIQVQATPCIETQVDFAG